MLDRTRIGVAGRPLRSDEGDLSQSDLGPSYVTERRPRRVRAAPRETSDGC